MSDNLTNLERVIAKNPTSSLFARLADACLQNGEVSRAIEVCRQGLRYRPSYVSGHVVLGKSHFTAGMFEEARRAFNKALHLDPHHTVAIWYLGQIDRTMGWDDLALRNFQKARDLDPLSRSLRTAIDEALSSISSQMGQRLQDEVGTEVAPEAHPAADRAGPVDERDDPVDQPTEEGPGREAEMPDVREEPNPPHAPTRLRPAEPAPDPVPLQPDDVPEGLPPERRELSRLMEEIETGGDTEASDSAPGSAHEETAAPDDAGGGAGLGGDPATNLLEAIQERVLSAGQPGRSRLSDNGESPARPPKGRTRETSRGEGKPRGGPVWDGLPIATATLGEIYAGQGFIAQAIAIFQKILEREPENDGARMRLGALMEQLAAGLAE